MRVAMTEDFGMEAAVSLDTMIERHIGALSATSEAVHADSDEAAPLFRDDCAPGFRDDLAPCLVGSAGD
ncbi:hypothetical protein CN238_35065, partial [Sinorhizobium meliloti]